MAAAAVLAVGAVLAGAGPAQAAGVSIPDPALLACIDHVVGAPPGVAISPAVAATVTTLGCTSATPITDLTGLASMPNLTQLSLPGATVSDLSPLAGLTRLVLLNLSSSTAPDLSPLAGLTGLRTLYIAFGWASGLDVLSKLIGLTALSLSGSAITDLSALGGLANLSTLDLRATGATDLSPLAALSNLAVLNLSGTGVSNLSALAGRTGLAQLDLSGAAITDISSLANSLAAMTAANSTFNITGQTATGAATPGAAVPIPIIGIDGSPVTSLSVTTNGSGTATVNAPAGTITYSAPGTYTLTWSVTSGGSAGRGQVAFSGADTVTVADAPASITRSAPLAPTGSSAVAIPDAGLQDCITQALGLPAGSLVTAAQAATLPTLSCGSRTIGDLTGLGSLTGLTNLQLAPAQGADLGPLSGLSGLTTLDLSGSGVTDLSALAGLTRLTSINLSGTAVSNLSALSGLSALVYLNLSGTQVSDLTSLSGLRLLLQVILSGARVIDLSPLGGAAAATSVNGVINATAQQATGGTAVIGAAIPIPIIGLDGQRITDLTFTSQSGGSNAMATVNTSSATITFPVGGVYLISWTTGQGTRAFSGTYQITVSVAGVPSLLANGQPSASAPAGQSVTVTGAGFQPGENVQVFLRLDPTVPATVPGSTPLATVPADSSGNLPATPVTIPADTPAGARRLDATGLASNTPATPVELAVTTPTPNAGGSPGVTSAPNGGSSSPLASTGGPVAAMALAGLLLVLLGAGYLGVARRRRRG